jgi:hypothetical protein
MREVSKQEFYGLIYSEGLDVHPRIDGPYPFISVFIYQSGPNWRREFGRIVTSVGDKPWPLVEKYYLS